MIALSVVATAWTALSSLFSAATWARRIARFTDGHSGVGSAALAWSNDRASRALGVAIEPRTWLWLLGLGAALFALVTYTWFVADWQSKADRIAAHNRAAIRNVELESASANAVRQLQSEREKRAAAEDVVRQYLGTPPEVVEVPVTVERRVEVPIRVPAAPAHTPSDLRQKLNDIR